MVNWAGKDVVDVSDRQPPPSLVEEQREATRARIRRAAMEVVARRGFDATVEEIAQSSGVSPRTIFRHYTSHDRLIFATVNDIFEACGRPAEDLGDDVDGWLESIALTIHTRNIEILGDAFWDIHSPSSKTSEVLSEVNTLRPRIPSPRGGLPDDHRLGGSRRQRRASQGSGACIRSLFLGVRHAGTHRRFQPIARPDRVPDRRTSENVLSHAVRDQQTRDEEIEAIPVRTDDSGTAVASKAVTGVDAAKEPQMPTDSELPSEGTPT